MDKILLKVKENPVRYLGKPSLKLLRAFINGYLICWNQITESNSHEFYPGFQEFVLQKYNIEKPTTHHWSDVIRFHTFDDEQAFYQFFELLDKLKAKQSDITSDFITEFYLSEEESMDILDNIVLKIKERPEQYLGTPSLALLNVFINGCSAYINEINEDGLFEFYPRFQDFVEQKHDIRIAAHWSKIINFITSTDDKAFYWFFELLNEFKVTSKKENTIDKILLKVKENPVQYLGKPSLDFLSTFISGYLICRDHINNKNSLEFYPGLEEFILRKYDIQKPTSHNFFSVIRFNSFTEEQAFYKFFELLDEFNAKQTYTTSYFITDLHLHEAAVVNILDDLLWQLRRRPGLYLGTLSLDVLNAYINGCLAYINQINGDGSFKFHPGFQEFVVQKYDIKIAAHWSKIINFVTGTDKEALYKFFELSDEFKEKQKNAQL